MQRNWDATELFFSQKPKEDFVIWEMFLLNPEFIRGRDSAFPHRRAAKT